MASILNHLKTNAVAYLALFIALGGTSYAAITLPVGSVGNRQLKNHSVSANKLDRSSIAGYVRDWAEINSLGKVVASRPAAHTLAWNTTTFPGGQVQWSRPIPPNCFALATTGVTPSVSYASAEVISAGAKKPGGAYVDLSNSQSSVSVAVLCPQP